MNRSLKEVYDFDGSGANISHHELIQLINAWRGSDASRISRIYHEDPAFEGSALLGKMPGLKPTTMNFGNVNVTEAHDGDVRSLVVVPLPFLSTFITIDAHQWMPQYWPTHALSKSSFVKA